MVRIAVVMVAWSLLSFLPAQASESFRFPENAGYLNIEDFGGRGNDTIDDTQAFRDMFQYSIDSTSNRYSAFYMLYLPKGTYIISQTLEYRSTDTTWSYGWRPSMFLFGENRDSTIIRLKDSLPLFNDAAAPLGMLRTGSQIDATGNKNWKDGAGNQAFYHSIRNLTFDIGSGNDWAVGVDFLASNRGMIENVRVTNGRSMGYAGLLLDRAYQGPYMVKNVEINGFMYGIHADCLVHGITFEFITLRNQTQAGIYLDENTLHMRGLYSENRVPAVKSTASLNMLTLIDSYLKGKGSAANALSLDGAYFIRDVVVEGYTNAVTSSKFPTLTGQNGTKTTIAEFTSDSVYAVRNATKKSLRLKIEETPDYYNPDFSKWANVLDFGATRDSKTIDDDAAAIEAACAAGKPVVYLPRGVYHVSRAITIPAQVRQFVGFHAGIHPVNSQTVLSPGLIIEGGASDTLCIQWIRSEGAVQNNSKGVLVIKDATIKGYTNTASGGKVFLENIIENVCTFTNQQVWARQFNVEVKNNPMVQNIGGMLWILGFKNEQPYTILSNKDGFCELLGGNQLPLSAPDTLTPQIVNENGSFSGSWTDINWSTRSFIYAVRDVKGADTLLVRNNIGHARGYGRMVPLYVSRTLAVPDSLKRKETEITFPSLVTANAGAQSRMIPQIQISYTKSKPELRIRVSGINFEDARLSLFDIRGRIIRQTALSSNGSIAWNLSGKPDGMFFVRLTGKNQKTLTRRVMVLK